MKITYPDFTIDISVDEVIALMNANLFGEGSMTAPESIPKVPASQKTTKAKHRTNAKAIGTKINHLSHALLTGQACNGHQVRYANDGQEQPEPDAGPDELPHRDI